MPNKSIKSRASEPTAAAIVGSLKRKPAAGQAGWRLAILALPALALGAGVAQACNYQYACGANYTAPSTNQITVQGNQFFKDGVPWVAKGFTFQGLLCPDQTRTNCQSGMNTSALLMDAQGANELAAAQSWGADTARFLVSQAALDPKSNYYQSWYLPFVTNWIRAARMQGFVVMISMQWEPGSLETTWQQQMGRPMHVPATNNNYSVTTQAWQQLAPLFATDNGVMFEDFNEPGTGASATVTVAQAWAQWQSDNQFAVSAIRATGANNVILFQGLTTGHSFAQMPQPNGLVDPNNPTNPQFGYTVHPYETNPAGNPYVISSLNDADFYANFGQLSQTLPVMISEVNGTWANGCQDGNTPGVPATPAFMNGAGGLMNYAQANNIGFGGTWAFDMYGTIIQNISPTLTTWVPIDFSTFKGCYGVENGVKVAAPGYDFQQFYLTGTIPTDK